MDSQLRVPPADVVESAGSSLILQGCAKSDVVVVIPAEAVGRIIGKGGVAIRYLQSINGMELCRLSDNGKLNERMLRMRGTTTALQQAQQEIDRRLGIARKELSNASRKDHSWTLTSNGYLLTPRTVHKTGQAKHSTTRNHHAAKMHGKRKEKEKDLIKALCEMRERDNPRNNKQHN